MLGVVVCTSKARLFARRQWGPVDQVKYRGYLIYLIAEAAWALRARKRALLRCRTG
jgi:hypothetical protein